MMHFCIALLILVRCGAAYRTDIIGDESEAKFCEHRKHFTFKPTATCCDNKVVKPGINFDEHWDSCMSAAAAATPQEISWEIYACIIKKANEDKDTITLQEFTDLMTANYPEDIKTKIQDEVKTVSSLSASLNNFERLEKVRVTYYDIEMEVCEGMKSETKSYGTIAACSSWTEEHHRAGYCCKKSFPVDVRYKSLLDIDSDSTLTAQCRNEIHPELVKFNATETIEINLAEICNVVCKLHKNGDPSVLNEVINQREYWNFDINSVFKRELLPPWLNHIKEEAINYANSTFSMNRTIEGMKSYGFADVIGGDSNTFRSVNFVSYVNLGKQLPGENFETEFMRRRFHRNILHVPIACSIYREMLGQMEHYFFQDCVPMDVTEGPATNEVPENVATTEAVAEPTNTEASPDSETTPASTE